MIEIIFLVRFVGHLSKLAKSKGRSGGWGGLGVALWIGGEVTGIIIGTLADAGAGAYVLALLFAAIGATTAHFIVKGLRPAGEMMPGYAGVAGEGVFAPPGPPDLTNPYAAPRAR
ncbi:MAG: hypothetical protein ABSE49_05640 [Polyangiaceae bacterium]|jgi:hypothetical protein